MARTFSGTVTTAETKTFDGAKPSVITVSNLDVDNNLEVQVAEIHGTDSWGVIGPGKDRPYRHNGGIASVKVRGAGGVSTAYAIDLNVGPAAVGTQATGWR